MNTIQTLFISTITVISGFLHPQITVTYTHPGDTLGAQQEIHTPLPTALPEETSTPTPTSEPTPTPTPEPTATPIPSPTPTPVPKITYSSQQIDQFFADASSHYSVDIELLRRIARCESGYNTNARNLSYGGMFQFSSGTWSSFRTSMNKDPDPDGRFDPKEAIDTAAYAISVGRSSIWPVCAKPS